MRNTLLLKATGKCSLLQCLWGTFGGKLTVQQPGVRAELSVMMPLMAGRPGLMQHSCSHGWRGRSAVTHRRPVGQKGLRECSIASKHCLMACIVSCCLHMERLIHHECFTCLRGTLGPQACSRATARACVCMRQGHAGRIHCQRRARTASALIQHQERWAAESRIC